MSGGKDMAPQGTGLHFRRLRCQQTCYKGQRRLAFPGRDDTWPSEDFRVNV